MTFNVPAGTLLAESDPKYGGQKCTWELRLERGSHLPSVRVRRLVPVKDMEKIASCI
ncbi:hypothetical protein [Paenibacillus caui]|uniref:hypothetical protein n=1 Tax=Paenibacillus caui TaxID=2873927 RepID=UPI001CA9FC42|nr:hypothetical protein [Paenibacillus caui]